MFGRIFDRSGWNLFGLSDPFGRPLFGREELFHGHTLVGRVLARVICYLHWLILVSRQGYDRRLSRWSQALILFAVALFRVVEQYDWESVLMLE